MKDCASTACRNLVDDAVRVFCSRCRPGQTAEQHLADIADIRAQAAARRELQPAEAN